MNPDAVLTLLEAHWIWGAGALFAMIVVLFLPRVVWAIRLPFVWLNWLQWFLMAPAQYWMRGVSSWPRSLFFILSPVLIAYWLSAYLVMTPVRLINAVYFNMLLFWPVTLRDSVADVFHPRPGEGGDLRYAVRWIFGFPIRSIKVVTDNLAAILQGVAATLFDLVWPTLTLFHGTPGQSAHAIVRTGAWRAGDGNYAGTGIYFSIRKRVAIRYARSKGGGAVIVARVTLTPCRPFATLPERLRKNLGRDGDGISHGVKFPWASLQHFRHDQGGWYEFCVVQRARHASKRTWRVRPLCVLRQGIPKRVPGGMRRWPTGARGWTLLAATLGLYALGAWLTGYHLQ